MCAPSGAGPCFRPASLGRGAYHRVTVCKSLSRARLARHIGAGGFFGGEDADSDCGANRLFGHSGARPGWRRTGKADFLGKAGAADRTSGNSRLIFQGMPCWRGRACRDRCRLAGDAAEPEPELGPSGDDRLSRSVITRGGAGRLAAALCRRYQPAARRSDEGRTPVSPDRAGCGCLVTDAHHRDAEQGRTRKGVKPVRGAR